MGLIAITLTVAVFAWITCFVYRKAKYIFERLSAFQGPVALPFIGNLNQFHFKPEEFFEQAQGLAYMLRKERERICRVWFGRKFMYVPDDYEC
ncbi:hypothetical protein ANCDUO_17030 [Ancylostoma duodenale]|uniref:Unspecific monooxygenase n=1 Tax=Ancylostoma duodenale TaxID=51022 RepID=A0A0C2G1S7_9BILA|nr:hypothetical protein ANCDUO_17030 [Ancylostoma duodenale]